MACNWQSLINAVATLVVLAGPGVAALLLALANRSSIKTLPRREGDAPSNGGQGGGGNGVRRA